MSNGGVSSCVVFPFVKTDATVQSFLALGGGRGGGGR